MAMELSANELQTVQANAAVIWEERPVPCSRGLVYHRDGSGMVYKTEYQYDRDGDLVKKLKYNCDENGVLESAPYYTELYVYR